VHKHAQLNRPKWTPESTQQRCPNRGREKGRTNEAPAHSIGSHVRHKCIKNVINKSATKQRLESIEQLRHKVEYNSQNGTLNQ